MINRVVVALLASLVLIPISTLFLFFLCYLCDTLCVQFSSVVVPIMMMKEKKYIKNRGKTLKIRVNLIIFNSQAVVVVSIIKKNYSHNN